MPPSALHVKQLALDCGFDLAGIAAAAPSDDYDRYREWIGSGMAGEMTYLTDHRGEARGDPRNLMPDARSILCVGKLYNSPHPYSSSFSDEERGWISRYAWGADYHDILREGLERVAAQLAARAGEGLKWRICVDTAPLLERSYGRLAGLGWIGKNSCLISQAHGSWFFLGELLLNLELMPDMPPPDRCGSCRRCIDACPTDAFVLSSDGTWTLDSRSCISYLTIEKRGDIPEAMESEIGHHLFGCDICQEVCPWNRREHFGRDERFAPRAVAPPLAALAQMEESEFRRMFRDTPVWRAKYRGMLRNVAIAMGNSGNKSFLTLLERLSESGDGSVALAAKRAIGRIQAPIRHEPAEKIFT